MKYIRFNNGWLQKLLQNSGWMVLAQGARVIDVLVRSIIVARLLSLENFAAYAVSLAFVGLVTELANLNFGTVIITYGVRYQQNSQPDHLKALLKISYMFTVLISILAGFSIVAILAVSYDVFIEQAGLFLPIVVLGFASTFNLVDAINKPILRLVNQFRASCIVDVVMMVVNIIFVLVFLTTVPATPVYAIYSAAVCLLLMGAASTVVSWIVLSRVTPNWWRSDISLLAKGWQSMARMAIGNSLSSSVQRMMRKGDVLLLAALAPAGVVGLYDIGKKFSAMILLLRDAVAMAAYPQISKAVVSGQQNKLRHLILRLFKVGIPASTVIMLFVWYVSEWVIRLSFGIEYIDASPIFVILTITSMLFVQFFWANALLLNSRRVKAQLLANVAGLVTMVIVGLVLVPIWQEIGMAWAAVIGTVTQFGIVAFVSWKILNTAESISNSEEENSN